MNSRTDKYFNKENQKILSKYRWTIKNHTALFFDLNEYVIIIDLLLSENEIIEAKNACYQALKYFQKSNELLLKKAQIYIELKKPGKALKILSRLIKDKFINHEVIILQGIAYSIQGRLNDVYSKFDALIDQYKGKKQDIFHKIGLSFLKARQYEVSSHYLSKAYKLNSDLENIQYDLAYVYEKTGKLLESLRLFESYLDFNPFSKLAWYNIGIIYSKLDKTDKSIEAFEFSLALDPEFEEAKIQVATIYLELKKYNKARSYFYDIFSKNKQNPYICLKIAYCFEQTGDFRQALKFYRLTLKIDPDYADAYYGIGIVLLHTKKYNKSKIFLRKAIRMNKGNAEYWYTYAYLHNTLNKSNIAEKSYKKCLQIDSFTSSYWLAYALVYYDKGNYTKSIQILKKSFNYISDTVLINYTLSACYYKIKNYSLAIKYLKVGIKSDNSYISRFVSFCPDALNHQVMNELIQEKQ